MGFTKLRTNDGSVLPPLIRFLVEADKNSQVETRGLPICTRGNWSRRPRSRLVPPAGTRSSGLAFGRGLIAFPEQAPISVGSPVTFFNGPPLGGDPTVIVHSHIDVPTPTTYLIPVRIERVDRGPIGMRFVDGADIHSSLFTSCQVR